MEIKKIEAFLLEIYYRSGEVATFRTYMLRMFQVVCSFTVMVYLLLCGMILFDSWDSFVTWTVREEIDINIIIFVLLTIPIGAPAVVWINKMRMSKMKTAGEHSPYAYANLAGLGSLGVVLAMIYIIFIQDPETEIVSGVNGLLIMIIGCNLGIPAGLYRFYLFKKYCPYLADYRGGTIRRPGESQDEDIED